jgi:hypothetical protein
MRRALPSVRHRLVELMPQGREGGTKAEFRMPSYSRGIPRDASARSRRSRSS